MAAMMLGFHLSGIKNSLLETRDTVEIEEISLSDELGEVSRIAVEDGVGGRDGGLDSGTYSCREKLSAIDYFLAIEQLDG